MAQKRMFDKRITDSDRFMDLPNSTKALYFMAGMSADDRGFFQPRRLQRMCGFTDDDFKILIAKGYLIPFESGVMVITDWNKNNWLDSRRITETEYVDELKLLKVINEKYELNSSCLADAKQMLSQNSIEENSIEENSIEENNNMSILKSNAPDLEAEFDVLWKLYPNKKSKKDALRHYIRARKKGVSYDEVLNGITNYLNYIKVQRIKPNYIKHGSTWFNQECWNDDYSVDRELTTKDFESIINLDNFKDENIGLGDDLFD